MGVVLAAYDTELDRKVALKLLEARQGREGRERMQREAQALAQLQHPNVVAVFETGEIEGHVYLAMEYIEGLTFDRWAQAHVRSWREVLDVALRAGRGLAAAHAAGVVHRDFKPSNVLVGADARVRVVDFGIAVTSGTESADLGGGLSLDGGDSLPRLGSLTETGTVVGTPAYMAPEQHAGEDVIAASDQFAFCVSLWRMLYGQAPFAGRYGRELRQAIMAGEVEAPPADVGVPAWLRRIVRRGLEADPGRRWPSMNALLDALSRGDAARRRVRVLATVAVLGGAAVVGVVAVGPNGAVRCGDVRIGTWDDARRAEVQTAFEATKLTYADESFQRVEARLDRIADGWSELSQVVCEAEREHPRAVHDLQRTCLARRRSEVAAVVEVLAAADSEVVARATDAVANLPRVAACADEDALVTGVAPPPRSAAASVAEARDVIARVDALLRAGRFGPAYELALVAVEKARASDYDPVVVEAVDLLGMAQYETGDVDGAVELLADNALAAVAARHDEIAARSASRVSFLLGYRLARPAEGAVWSRHAAAAVQRFGEGTLIEAEHLVTRGGVDSAQGDYDAALAAFDRALEIQVAHLGESHPILGNVENNIGSILVYKGDYGRAAEHIQRALAIFTAAYGPNHPRVAVALNGLGVVDEKRGDLGAARDAHAGALAIRKRAFGDDSPEAALSMDNLGSVHLMLGELSAAIEHCNRALEIREATLGPEHPHVASSLVNLGLIAEQQGRFDDAVQRHQRAIRVFEGALGPDHPFLAHPLTSLGRSELALGHPLVAVETLERALALREASGTPEERGETRFALAQAAWAAGQPQRAQGLLVRAVDELPADGRSEAERWRVEHAASDPGEAVADR